MLDNSIDRNAWLYASVLLLQARMAPCISGHDCYDGLYNFYDPDSFLSDSAMLYSHDLMAHEVTRVQLETNAMYLCDGKDPRRCEYGQMVSAPAARDEVLVVSLSYHLLPRCCSCTTLCPTATAAGPRATAPTTQTTQPCRTA
jgi:hypothetical protein